MHSRDQQISSLLSEETVQSSLRFKAFFRSFHSYKKHQSVPCNVRHSPNIMSHWCHLTWWAVPGCLDADLLHAWVGSSDLSHRKWHKGDFVICCVVSQIKICQILLDGLRCHSNLSTIVSFIQWLKETCCLQSIWKLIFLIVLSFLLCICIQT